MSDEKGQQKKGPKRAEEVWKGTKMDRNLQQMAENPPPRKPAKDEKK